MHFVGSADLRDWYREGTDLRRVLGSIGRAKPSMAYLEQSLGLPLHMQFVVKRLAESEGLARRGSLSSISFYNLCRGLFLPMTRMQPGKVAQVFGIGVAPPPDTEGRDLLVQKLFDQDIGLILEQKLACLLGDAFMGRTSTFKRDSMLRLLGSVTMRSRRQMLDRLTQVGDVGVLFAEARPRLREEPPLTASEVLLTLQFLPDAKRNLKFDLLRSLMLRMGKVEAYFLARLMLQKADFGFEYEGALVARKLGAHFGADPDHVAHAIALSDPFHVARILGEKGPEGLREVRLQPLVAVKPALASGSTSKITNFPVWVERKYDGIRFMMHKSTDSRGHVLCAAYTRGRRDWLELVPGLTIAIRNLPCQNCIIDGELYGTVLDFEGARPATVYEVYSTIQGERQQRAVNLKYAAFDLVYVNGSDITGLPLQQRRQHLEALVRPLSNLQLPIPLTVADGQLARDKNDVKRLYQHFRSQGYEGIISKDLGAGYALARRDPNWLKRKPEITFDLALLGAVFAVTTKDKAGVFGSFVIGAKSNDGGFSDVGDVAGVDRIRDAEIQGEIMRNGLITGKRIERQSASGVRPGVELRPHMVVTVRFEGIIKDNVTGELKLRDPKMVAIRSDKNASECNSLGDIEALYLRQRMG